MLASSREGQNATKEEPVLPDEVSTHPVFVDGGISEDPVFIRDPESTGGTMIDHESEVDPESTGGTIADPVSEVDPVSLVLPDNRSVPVSTRTPVFESIIVPVFVSHEPHMMAPVSTSSPVLLDPVSVIIPVFVSVPVRENAATCAPGIGVESRIPEAMIRVPVKAFFRLVITEIVSFVSSFL